MESPLHAREYSLAVLFSSGMYADILTYTREKGNRNKFSLHVGIKQHIPEKAGIISVSQLTYGEEEKTCPASKI